MFEGLDDAYPLSPLQLGMLYETLKHPDSDVYVAYIVIDIKGTLDQQALLSAWQATVRQHETLRTRFMWEELDEPLQLVNSDVELQWSHCPYPSTVASLAAGDAQAIVEYWLDVERGTPLSLSDSPPTRFRLIDLPSDRQVLIWTVHHLLADDWSTPLVLQSVANHVAPENRDTDEALVEGSTFSYSHYIHWLAESDDTGHLSWWKTSLAGASPTPVRMESAQTDLASIPNNHRHHRFETTLTLGESQRIAELSRTCGCTLSSIMHAAWALVVARYAGTSFALFGTSVSGRSCALPGITEAVGLFLNTLPTSVAISPDELIDEYLNRVQRQLFEQIQHEHIALSTLATMMDKAAHEQPFDTVMVVEAHGADMQIDVPGTSASFGKIRYITDSNFPLTVLVFPGRQLSIQLVGPTQCYSYAAMQAICAEFTSVIHDLCSPDIGDIDTVRARQVQRIQAHYSNEPLAACPAYQSIDLWIQQAVSDPATQLAVIDAGIEYTYQHLFTQAQRLSDTLRTLDSPSEYIGICLPRSFNQLAAILSVLMAGKAYVPMDCDWPRARIEQILLDAQITILLSDAVNSEQCAFVGCRVVAIDKVDEAYSANAPHYLESDRAVNFNPEIHSVEGNEVGTDTNPGALAADVSAVETKVGLVSGSISGSISDSDTSSGESSDLSSGAESPAYMIYTSGSTGRPKGVSISHRNLIYSTRARIQQYTDKPERYLLLSPYSFDSSVAGIFWTWCTGGTLVLPGAEKAFDVHQLEDQISRYRVTHTLCLPTLYSLLLRFGDAEKLSSLRNVIVAGEASSAALVRQHKQTLSQTKLFNEYGPTEGTVWATVMNLGDATLTGSGAVPIGHAIPGTEVQVVDQQGLLCPPGVSGEIVILGPGVAKGYHGDAALTQSRFKDNTYLTGDRGVMGLDGQLLFLGRVDDQLKIRGHRVEPGEIVSRVESDDRVGEAFCRLMSTVDSDQDSAAPEHLVCFYTLSDDSINLLDHSGDNLTTESCHFLANGMQAEKRSVIECAADARIRSELPEYYTVFEFVAVNRMPRLPNGKIDASGFLVLQAQEAAHNGTVNDSNDPTRTESSHSLSEATCFSTLCQILKTVLGLDSVQPSDNYFSLGGDSLSAIRFVATAREQGVALTIPMVSAFTTIGELAQAVDQAEQKSAEGSAIAHVGATPLTPIQRWFFSLQQPRPVHWNMAFTFQLQKSYPVETVQDAVLSILTQFPVLASQFVTSNQIVSAYIGEQPDFSESVRVVQHGQGSLTDHLLQSQNHFNLSTGKLIGCCLEQDEDGGCQVIGIVVHHLVTDAVSNWHLARSITEYVQSLGRLSAPVFQAAGYRQWAILAAQTYPDSLEPVVDHDSGESAADQHVTKWISSHDSNLPATDQAINKGVPTCYESEGSHGPLPIWLEGNVTECRLAIDAKRIASLGDVARRSDATLAELLLNILLRSLHRHHTIRVDVETHGRDVSDIDLETSASVGWFTRFFQLVCHADALTDFSQFARYFRDRKTQGAEQFLRNPQGFFATEQRDVTSSAMPAMLYNFLAINSLQDGTTQGKPADGFQFEPLIDLRFRNQESRRSHAIEVVVMDDGTGIGLLWRIDKNLDHELGLPEWVDRVSVGIDALINEFQGQAERTVSESFPDSGLSDEELDQFLSELE